MLDIIVFDKYRITSDEYNVIVSRKRIVDPTKSPNWDEMKKKGASPEKRIEWNGEPTYHSSVESALQKIVDLEIRNSNVRTIEELLREIKRIKREISDVLSVRV